MIASLFQESILLDEEQDKALKKTDAIITGAAYKNQPECDPYDSFNEDPYSDYEPARSASKTKVHDMNSDRVNFDTGIPMGIREAPMG